MRRTASGVLSVWVIGMVALVVPASTQGPSRGRADVEIVNGHEAAAREVLVRFRGGMAAGEFSDLRSRGDVEAIEEVGGLGVFRLRSRSMDVASLLGLLARRGDVLYAEPNFIVRSSAVPSDTAFPQLWALENLGQSVNGGLPGTTGSDIRAVRAWDISVGSSTHVVAVIDSGIDYSHLDLAGNMWSAPAAFRVNLGDGTTVHCAAGTHGFDAISRTCNPMDDHSHGTHVAGTIGATGNNGLGVVGVNWTTRLMGIKFLDGTGAGTISGAVDAIRFAIEARRALGEAADVRIISASWGGSGFSQALLDEINAAAAEDMLFVAAAGNSGLNNDLLPTYPASYSAPNLIAVAATTNTDGRAWFSNYGAASVHLGAPGVDILSTTPKNSYTFASGTSMATPHVSGAAALVLARCAMDTAGLKDALLGSVQPVAALASVTITGGRLDVNSAIHSCVAPPESPSNLTAAGGDSQVLLSWSAALGATGYVVKRSVTAGGPYAPVATGVKGARYTDTTVSNGTTYYYVVSATNPLGESGDSNEAFATPNQKSDLVVSALAASARAAAGSALAVSMTTANQAGGPAAPSTTRLYLSLNTSLDAADQALEPASDVPALEPGQSSTASPTVSIPEDTRVGRWYLLAMADANLEIVETQEWNNTRIRSILIGPDLVVDSLTAPATAAPGDALEVSETVRNGGAGLAAASTTVFYLSTDVTLGESDTLLAGGRAVPALDTDASSSGSTTVTIPASTPLGSYYLIAKADGGNSVAESQETNNTRARSVRIGADLVVSAFSAPGSAGAGSTIAVSDTTTNQGASPAAESVTRFYLSSDYRLDAGDAEVGGRAVHPLEAGGSSSAATELVIPEGTPTGSYYVLAVADADHQVPETLESNNHALRLVHIGGDLRVSALSAPTLAAPGASIAVTDTTLNQGGGSAGPSVTRYYFSANIVLDAQDQMLGGRPVPGLSAGASHTGSVAVTIPTDVTAGTYYVIAKADADGAVVETQEGNNMASTTVKVGGDLAVSAFAAPAKGGAGLSVVVSDTTVNQGTAAAGPSITRFYLSTNVSFDAADTELGGRAVPELPPGAGSSGSATLTVPSATPVGSYYLIARADADGVVIETQEGNNTAARGIQIGPDLGVSTLSVPSKVEAGSTIAIGDTTINNGGGSAPSSVTTFALSADWRLNGDDAVLDGSRVVGPLAPGASSTAQASVTVPAGVAPGSYYLIAIADGPGSIPETLEGNNTRSQLIRIGPDLAVSTASMSVSSVRAGSTAAVSDTVVNQGAGAAAPSATRFYLSSNLRVDAADLLLPGGRDVPQLPTDGTSSGSTLITVPEGTPPGSYYVLAMADADDAVAESVETNNAKFVRSIQVTAP